MNRAMLSGGAGLLAIGVSLARLGMTGHMAGHMIAVALAAPLLALGIAGGPADPAQRWPTLVTPLAMSVVELAVVWTWHLPALRAAAGHAPAVLLLEQLCFAGAGVLLWSAVIARPPAARATGVGALLLTSMHMTLLGALIGLAPRPLYPAMAMAAPFGLTALEDQQLAGVVMLLIGGAAYLSGGLAILSRLLRLEGATP